MPDELQDHEKRDLELQELVAEQAREMKYGNNVFHEKNVVFSLDAMTLPEEQLSYDNIAHWGARKLALLDDLHSCPTHGIGGVFVTPKGERRCRVCDHDYRVAHRDRINATRRARKVKNAAAARAYRAIHGKHIAAQRKAREARQAAERESIGG